MIGAQPDVVVVSSPSRAEYLHVLRAVTSSAASRARLSFDAVEDLRLAVGEAAGILLGVAGATTLTLRVEGHTDRLEVLVQADAAVSGWPPAGLRESVPWVVLHALVDDLRAEVGSASTSLLLVKRTLDAPARR